VVADVVYIPPVSSFKAERMTEELYEKLVCGQSIVHLRCSVCGDISQRQVLGKFEKPTDKAVL
jgi:hypothetical protein